MRRADHSLRGVLPGVCVCDVETSNMRWLMSYLGCCIAEKKIVMSSIRTVAQAVSQSGDSVSVPTHSV